MRGPSDRSALKKGSEEARRQESRDRGGTILGPREMAFTRANREWQRIRTMSPEQIRTLQLERLNRVLSVAATVEPYRSLWLGASHGPVDDLEALRDLPVIGRLDLTALPLHDRMPAGASADHRSVSSGTSGRPLEVGWSAAEFGIREAHRVRAIEHAGFMRKRILNFVFGAMRNSPLATWRGHAYMGTFVDRADQLAAVRTVRPDVLIGSPSLLLDLAPDLEGLKLAGLATGSEVLTPEMRAELRARFGADSVDIYGLGESSTVSWQCSRRNYHVDADAVIVEILDEGGSALEPGQIGEVTLTTLWQTTSPLVRYRTGDIAALLPEPCNCGLPLPLMSQVEGRRDDWVIAADGRRIAPFRFLIGTLGTDLVRDHVRAYRVIQQALDDFVIEVEWKDPAPEKVADRARAAYSRVVGMPVRVAVRSVERLTNPQAGKFRMVESLVKPEKVTKPGTSSDGSAAGAARE
ncbi:MAG: phenylacetate--CoA ligase family protein [Actinomycetota bacterium]